MRADRLLSLLMLLQVHGKLSARELATRLEVSERTIYRDMDALSAAGVPVYGECGRQGGFDLLDSYKTSLTGLTEGELRALFMLDISQPLEALGISQEFRQAMLKISAALPDARRAVEEQVRQRFYLDSAWWHADSLLVPHLRTVYQAVQQDRGLHIRIRPIFNVEIELLVDPLGLVAKAGVWYLVCARAAQMRVLRVSELMEARLSDEGFVRPGEFDLAAWWQAWCLQRAGERLAYEVSVRVAPGFLPFLPYYIEASLGDQTSQAGVTDTQGGVMMKLYFESLEEARKRLLGCGRGVEVLAPEALRLSILDYAQQTVNLYRPSEDNQTQPVLMQGM